MTTEVDVHLKQPITDEKIRTNLAKRFNEIHDQTFKQEVDLRPQSGGTLKGTVEEMKHADYFLWIDDKFFYIPCHWSYEHAVETRKNIRQVLKEFGLDATTKISY